MRDRYIEFANSLLEYEADDLDIFRGIGDLSDNELAHWLGNYGSPLARLRLCDDAFQPSRKKLFCRMSYITSRLNSGALPDDIFPDAAG